MPLLRCLSAVTHTACLRRHWRPQTLVNKARSVLLNRIHLPHPAENIIMRIGRPSFSCLRRIAGFISMFESAIQCSNASF